MPNTKRLADYDPAVPDRKHHLTDDQIGVAILWLENNEGDEAEDCQAVADWLKTELNRRAVRQVAKTHGVPMRIARAALAKAESKS